MKIRAFVLVAVLLVMAEPWQFIDFAIGLCENPRQWCPKMARDQGGSLPTESDPLR
jgi:hypothetical protein